MNDDGSGLVQLTDNVLDGVNPSWSPHGRCLGFGQEDRDNPDLYVTSAERLLLLCLPDRPADDFGGSWREWLDLA